jgi:hypothetical protein
MKRRHWSVIAVLALSFAAGGCLQRDVTETWYVDGSGAVTWVVSEQNVRSDARAALDRRTEEGEYWLAVQQDRHGMLEGLRELRADKIRTVVLRAESPYSVQTEGRFTGLDILGQRLIAAVGVTGTSVVRRNQTGWEWTLVLRDPTALDATGEPSTGISDLVNDLDHLKVVLTAGRFDGAEGFSLSNDGRIATFDYKQSNGNDSDPVITLKLTWTTFSHEE